VWSLPDLARGSPWQLLMPQPQAVKRAPDATQAAGRGYKPETSSPYDFKGLAGGAQDSARGERAIGAARGHRSDEHGRYRHFICENVEMLQIGGAETCRNVALMRVWQP